MAIKLLKKEIEIIKDILYRNTGIQVDISKKTMIENRLNRLIDKKKLDKTNIKQILKEIETKYLQDFINVFTTNKTNFFREKKQFDYLYENILINMFNKGSTVNIYCAASSTGEEPWSLSATCYLASKKSKFKYSNYSIFATDIDTEILEKAKKGVYECLDYNKQLFPLWLNPNSMFVENIQKCKNKDKQNDTLTINQELRKKVKFKQLNLMDKKYDIIKNNFYNIIFCRNVLIYFSKEDQKEILIKLTKKLKLNGFLFLGHSEHLNGLEEHYKRKGNNIYQKIKEM